VLGALLGLFRLGVIFMGVDPNDFESSTQISWEAFTSASPAVAQYLNRVERLLGAITFGFGAWSSAVAYVYLKKGLRDCHTLKFHSSDGSWAYEAGGTGGGASVSKDGGASWSKVKDGLDRHYGVACAADPDQPDLWYVSVSPGPGKAHSIGNARAHIYRSEQGNSWERLAGGLPQPLDSMPYGLATVPGRPGLVIAALKNGQVWGSEDHGESWSQLPVGWGSIGLGLAAIAM